MNELLLVSPRIEAPEDQSNMISLFWIFQEQTRLNLLPVQEAVHLDRRKVLHGVEVLRVSPEALRSSPRCKRRRPLVLFRVNPHALPPSSK